MDLAVGSRSHFALTIVIPMTSRARGRARCGWCRFARLGVRCGRIGARRRARPRRWGCSVVGSRRGGCSRCRRSRGRSRRCLWPPPGSLPNGILAPMMGRVRSPALMPQRRGTGNMPRRCLAAPALPVICRSRTVSSVRADPGVHVCVEDTVCGVPCAQDEHGWLC